MGLPNVMQTGQSGLNASKAAVATTGHNISNANTEGFSRQRVDFKTREPHPGVGSKGFVGRGVNIDTIRRVNDEYLEKQLRDSGRQMEHYQEKDVSLQHLEDIFNEMNGEGLNRLMSRFFNEFRKLANEPDSEAIRQSIREASQALVNDFHRIRGEVKDVQRHIDSRLEGYVREVNALAQEIKDLNLKIRTAEAGGASANDLNDQRDLALKKLATYMDFSMHKDEVGAYHVDIKGIGPFIAGPQTEQFGVYRSKADDQGKPENALDLTTTASASSIVTHQVKGGKFGALLEVRDQSLMTVLNRLDELAYHLSGSINEIHEQGFNRVGVKGIQFFKPLGEMQRAAEVFDLSDDIKNSANNIATAAQADAPGDNRVAIAISGIQGLKLLNQGTTTMDDFYNSIVSDVGVVKNRNKSSLNQTQDILTQLSKMRDQISGVSIDEETANLLQYQHTYDAAAKVIQVADQMLKTVLELGHF